MVNRLAQFAVLLFLAVGAPRALPQETPLDARRAEVFAAERAFARSMADRDFTAFSRYVAPDAIFFGSTTQRGREAVLAGWRPFFDGAKAPFSWEPDQVEVLATGELALSTGSVQDPEGMVIARFNSVWRRDTDGAWRVVFDKGSPVE